MFEAPDLNLIDPNNEAEGAMAYSSPSFSPTVVKASSNTAKYAMYASMGVSAVGAIATTFQQAAAFKARGDYEATLARTNATIAALQAKQALQAGDAAASRKNLETQARVGDVRATQAGSGTDVASGSNAITQIGTEHLGAVDELTIRNNAARQAWGFQTEAIEDTYKGEFATLNAKARVNQTLVSGGLQALEGPLAIESTYLRFARYMGGNGGASGLPYPDMRT